MRRRHCVFTFHVGDTGLHSVFRQQRKDNHLHRCLSLSFQCHFCKTIFISAFSPIAKLESIISFRQFPDFYCSKLFVCSASLLQKLQPSHRQRLSLSRHIIQRFFFYAWHMYMLHDVHIRLCFGERAYVNVRMRVRVRYAWPNAMRFYFTLFFSPFGKHILLLSETASPSPHHIILRAFAQTHNTKHTRTYPPARPIPQRENRDPTPFGAATHEGCGKNQFLELCQPYFFASPKRNRNLLGVVLGRFQ